MKQMAWLIALGAIAGMAYWLWRMRERWQERRRASEERLASFVAQTLPKGAGGAPAAPKVAHDAVVQQRLLMEAAAKAGEAGEPALAIQLYAKLLVRYPQSSFADPARAAVATQKQKLAAKP